MSRVQKSPRRPARGFSLVEVILALGIMSFALVTIFGLISVGLNDATNSTEKNRAAALLSGIAADLSNTPPGLGKTSLFQITPTPFTQRADGIVQANGAINVGSDVVSYAGDDQQLTAASVTSPSNPSKFRVTLRYTRVPGKSMLAADASPSVLSSVEALLVISWPPNADPFGKTPGPAPQGSVETYLSLPVP